LKVALVGGGFMGKAHSLAWSMAPIGLDLNATVTKEAIVDIRPDLPDVARQLGWNTFSDDWKSVLKRDDIDIIDVCTPPQFHAEIALAAIAAGKHVFCEKPITNDVAEALVMAKAARAAGVQTQVGFNYRHTPAISFAKLLLEDGRLGRPLQFRGSFLQEGGFTADPNRWRALKSTGGSGTVGDIGSHIVDIAEYLFGDIRRVSARVRSRDTEVAWKSESERIGGDLIDDAGVWLAEFESGAIGTFAVSSFASGHKNHIGFEFDASRGGVEFDWNDREVLRVSFIDEEPDLAGFRTISTSDKHPDGWWRLAGLGTGYPEISAIQFQHFIRGILSGEGSHPDFGDGAHSQLLVEAIAEAAVSDHWVDVPRRSESR
jgi:predicted dehydrogenase